MSIWNYNKITRRFLIGEAYESPTIGSYIQSLEEIISNIKTNVSGRKRLEIAKSHLREVRRNFRKMKNEVKILKEQVYITCSFFIYIKTTYTYIYLYR